LITYGIGFSTTNEFIDRILLRVNDYILQKDQLIRNADILWIACMY